MLVVLLGAPECGKTTQAERISAALGLAKVHIADVGGNDASDAELAASVADLAAGDRCAAGLTLEGFPSTLAQADALDDALGAKGMKVSKVVYIDVGECEWLEQADPLLSMYFDRGVLTAVDGRPFVEAVEEQIMAGLADVMAPAEPAGEMITPYVPGAEPDAKEKAQLEFEAEVAAVRWIDPRSTQNGFSIGVSTTLLPLQKESKGWHSNARYRQELHMHQRMKLNPAERFPAPVVASMDIGWDSRRPELYKKDPDLFHPRMKSRETQYAEALILGPRHP